MEANTEPTTNPTPTQTIRNRSDAALDAVMLDRVVLQNDLRLYIRHAWHVVEPSTVYLENWHIDLIAEYLEAVTAGQIKRLLINMPPRYAKSTCVSIMWPTWVWTREPFPGKPHNAALGVTEDAMAQGECESCVDGSDNQSDSCNSRPLAHQAASLLSRLRRGQAGAQRPRTLPGAALYHFVSYAVRSFGLFYTRLLLDKLVKDLRESLARGRPSLRRRARLLRSSRPRAGQVRNGAPPPRRGASGQPGGRRHSASADKHSMSPIRLCRSRASPDCCRVGTARSAITSTPRKFWTSFERWYAGQDVRGREDPGRGSPTPLWSYGSSPLSGPGALARRKKTHDHPPIELTSGRADGALPVRAVRGTAESEAACGRIGRSAVTEWRCL